MPTVKPAPDVNIEELERQLRLGDTPDMAADDPLAELTRLIESFDSPQPPTSAVVDLAARRAVGVQPRPAGNPPAAPVDDLRGTLAAESEAEPEPESFDELTVDGEFAPDEFADDAAEHAGPAPRRWLLRSAAVIAIGVAGFGYYFYNHGGLPGSAKAPPTILAVTTPAKVQPPTQQSVVATDDSAAVLRPNPAAVSPAPKIVGSVEQPVDVKAELAVEPQPPTPSANADGLKVTQGAGGAVIAQAIADPPPPPAKTAAQAVVQAAPAPAPTALAPSSAPVATAAPDAIAALANPPAPSFPAPTKQHSVVIRPDGSLVSDAMPAAPVAAPSTATLAAPAPAAPAINAAQPAERSSTPKLDVANRGVEKSIARVVTPKPVAPAPVATGAPLQLVPAAQAKPPALPTKLAKPAPVDATPSAPATDTTPPNASAPADGAKGAWSVQLAAPRSQAEADATVAKLQGQYADALGGNALSVHKAQVNGETIYRVRAAGLDKTGANALCAKVHSAGGACFLAR